MLNDIVIPLTTVDDLATSGPPSRMVSDRSEFVLAGFTSSASPKRSNRRDLSQHLLYRERHPGGSSAPAFHRFPVGLENDPIKSERRFVVSASAVLDSAGRFGVQISPELFKHRFLKYRPIVA